VNRTSVVYGSLQQEGWRDAVRRASSPGADAGRPAGAEASDVSLPVNERRDYAADWRALVAVTDSRAQHCTPASLCMRDATFEPSRPPL